MQPIEIIDEEHFVEFIQQFQTWLEFDDIYFIYERYVYYLNVKECRECIAAYVGAAVCLCLYEEMDIEKKKCSRDFQAFICDESLSFRVFFCFDNPDQVMKMTNIVCDLSVKHRFPERNNKKIRSAIITELLKRMDEELEAINFAFTGTLPSDSNN